jgi:hypothetical protein
MRCCGGRAAAERANALWAQRSTKGATGAHEPSQQGESSGGNMPDPEMDEVEVMSVVDASSAFLD